MLGVPIRFMRALLDFGLSLGEDLSHVRRDDLRESCLASSQGVSEVRKELGSSVNRDLAKRFKALVGPRDDALCLRRCEVRECFDLLTSRRVYSDESCLVHICSFSLKAKRAEQAIEAPSCRTTSRRAR